MQLIALYIFAETTCLVIALYYLRGEGWNRWGLQRTYLSIALATELTGWYLREIPLNNLPLYNCFILVECLVMSLLLRGFLQPLVTRPLTPWLWGWLVFFAMMWGMEWGFSTAEYVYLNYSIVLMSLVFMFACGYYFYRLLLVAPYRHINRHAPFWWVSGTAIFYLGGLATPMMRYRWLGMQGCLDGLPGRR